MKLKDIGFLRLYSQLITDQQFDKPEKVVEHMGAMQAQDFGGALWSIGLRTKNATLKTIEQAIDERKIVRSWPMRGTLHFVASKDLRWMIHLLAPRIIAASAGRHKQLELTETVFLKSIEILEKELAAGKQLTRDKVYSKLENGGISCLGQRGIHIIGHLARLGYICHGSHQGKQPTYVWLDSWIPKTAPIEKDEALAKLALTYFKSHGPATLKDFVWWSGLRVVDAKVAIALISHNLLEQRIADSIFWMVPELPEKMIEKKAIFLLPGFDEYMLGYANRTWVIAEADLSKIIPGNNGVFMPTIVIDSRVSGVWKRTITTKGIEINLFPFDNVVSKVLDRVKTEAERYGAFMERKVLLKI